MKLSLLIHLLGLTKYLMKIPLDRLFTQHCLFRMLEGILLSLLG